MKTDQKQHILTQAKEHLTDIRDKIRMYLEIKEKQEHNMTSKPSDLPADDRIAQAIILKYTQQQIDDLTQLYPSPYFTRLDFESDGDTKQCYIGKFSFSDEGIYSWITPIASLRFEDPGEVSYIRYDTSHKSGTLHRKDNFHIVDGKIMFLSTEGIDTPRELIHQEHFTRQKQGFMLPDVVEQMEKAQDQVIRADYRGPFVIAGPAGSGKTTLALHRVAYLMQSPETAELFTPHHVLVLVQDKGTKNYFSHLLPDLGIKQVEIQTFDEWAYAILDIEDAVLIHHDELTDAKKYTLEHNKLQALRNPVSIDYTKNHAQLLKKIYEQFLDTTELSYTYSKLKEKQFDRIDLTLLLNYYYTKFNEFSITKEYYHERANGNYTKKKTAFPLSYNLLIIDEFQNYLPEQLTIMRQCLNTRLRSVVYVGDLAQQTQLGTITDWNMIEKNLHPERHVKLQKVYRNTKQILNYLASLGYSVTIPESLAEGSPVHEKICANAQEEIDYIKRQLLPDKNISIGILGKDAKYLDAFKKEFGNDTRIHILNFHETQGVEFEHVFIVGMREDTFSLTNIPDDIKTDVEKMYRDILYVALTRAMRELHVLHN